MAWTTTGDLDEFLAAAGGFLRARPASNTILLTTTDNLGARGMHTYGPGDPHFGWWRATSGEVAGAFLRTPPLSAVLTDLPADAIPSLVDALGDVPGFSAEVGVAELVAAEWARRTGGTPEVRLRSRLYRLGRLTPPRSMPRGRARIATAADRDLLVSWYELFTIEMGEPAENLVEAVDDRIADRALVLWETNEGPVSMAGHSRPLAGMIRVAPVFTPVGSVHTGFIMAAHPRGLRRRGYGGAVTAAVSLKAAKLAEEVLLYTDVANPTSNSLYLRLGYAPVEDRLVIATTPLTPALRTCADHG
jgi:predicted GNAT family acetyltransferase